MPQTSIRSLRGTLYDREVVGDLAKVVAPPYDVIDEDSKQALLERSPFNVVRLILPQPGGPPDFWRESADLFSRWKEEGVLTTDDGRGIYVYRQTFPHPSLGSLYRTGLLAAVKCVGFEDGDILPHERTFPRTRSERLNLLRACRANFSQVFMVFRDREGAILELLEKAVAATPTLAFVDYEGVGHELWRVDDHAGGLEISRRMEGRRLLIADGHHRYETALAYSREDAAASEAGCPRAFVSAVLFRSEDPGLVILPVHRVMRRCPLPARELARELERSFEVERVEGGRREAGMALSNACLRGGGRPGFAMLTREESYLLALKDDADLDESPGDGGSERWRRLDVNVLQSRVFGQAMGADAGELAERGDLYFTPWEDEVQAALDGGEAEVAFLMRATSMDEIWDIAEGGERMPHKSSYFHPKLPSGLVIYDHETAFS